MAKKTKFMRLVDKEINAMKVIYEKLDEFDETTQDRMLRFILSKIESDRKSSKPEGGSNE